GDGGGTGSSRPGRAPAAAPPRERAALRVADGATGRRRAARGDDLPADLLAPRELLPDRALVLADSALGRAPELRRRVHARPAVLAGDGTELLPRRPRSSHRADPRLRGRARPRPPRRRPDGSP